MMIYTQIKTVKLIIKITRIYLINQVAVRMIQIILKIMKVIWMKR